MFICNVLFFISIIFCVRPQKNISTVDELDIYIDALQRVSIFYKKNPRTIDMGGAFALFITNVNLKHSMDNSKNLTSSMRGNFRVIIENNKKSIKTYSKTANKKLARQHQAIPNLFTDISPWVTHLYPFTYTERRRRLVNPLKRILNYWKKYKKAVRDLKRLVPTPTLSNTCLASLGQFPVNKKKRILICPLKDACIEAVVNGTDFGYALSHRVFLILAARYGRGCSVLPTRQEKQLTEKLCVYAYTEILVHLENNFELGDLIFEFICVCSLAGHAEFLMKIWLNLTVNVQTTAGCFQRLGSKNLTDADKGAMNVCDHHSTSISICSLSVAVRFIIEKFKWYPI